MSTIIGQQPPLTPASHGSVGLGPVIGVLAVVLLLCAVAVVIGRLCSGRSIMGYGNYDMDTWLESNCSSCVDGRILVFTPTVTTSGDAATEASSTPASAAHHQNVAS